MINHRNRALVFVLPLALLLAAGTCQAQKYSVRRLVALPGGTNVSASGMNNAGVVVGDSDDANGNANAVKWANITPTALIVNPNPYPGSSSGAVAINNQNVIVGNARDTETFVFEIGPTIDAEQGFDHGISVGAISDTNVIVGIIEGHPVIWAGVDLSYYPPAGLPNTVNNHGSPAEPSGINNAGVIVGTEYDDLPDYSDTYPVAVRWTSDPVDGLVAKALSGLGGQDSSASAVNATGFAVGWATLGNKLMHAVVWGPTTGAFDLGTLGGKQSSAGAINVEGDIAGDAQDAYGHWHATLWTHKHYKAIDLNAEIDASLAKQITLTSAAATNDHCEVLANGIDNKTGAQAAFVLSLLDQSACNEP